MPVVKFYYFPIKALGEGPRLLLAYGGQEFQDIRVDKESWPEFKPKTKYGQMPILEIDGKQYAQSAAICRYLASRYGLTGADAEQNFEIDEAVDFFNDIRAKAAQVHYEEDEKVKEKRHETYSQTVYPDLLGKLHDIVQRNNGHLAANKLTWADFYFAGVYDYMKVMLRRPDLDQQYPGFAKVYETVYSLPKVKAFADAAPKTDF